MHLQNAVKDGLVDRYTFVGSKGSKVGIEQEGYKVPDVAENWVSTICFFCQVRTGGVIYAHVSCSPEQMYEMLNKY